MSTNSNKNTYTEAEARKLWCPMVRYVFDSEPPANRWWEADRAIKNSESCRCIAAECAMWRWHDHSDGERHGYCGLASV